MHGTQFFLKKNVLQDCTAAEWRDFMKKYIYTLVIVLFCIGCVDCRQVEAYSVTVQKDSVYAEAIPDSFVNNTGTIFKNYVKKAMKYYDKYRDEDYYTYSTKIPDEYREFIPVARQIQDTDEIIIRNPFYIYQAGDDTIPCEYCFIAEKNGEALCMFCIYIDPESGKTSFRYDKIEGGHFTYVDETMGDNHFKYDEESLGETLFYMIDDIIYAETPGKISVVWDRRRPDGAEAEMMSGDGARDWKGEQEAMDREFQEKNYSEKKETILAYLKNPKNSKIIKKVDKNLKLELKDEHVEPEEDVKEKSRTGNFITIGMYILVGIGILVIGVLIGGVIGVKNH